MAVMGGDDSTFSCVIRGFHTIKDFWWPEIGDKFTTEHESTNRFDSNAMMVLTEMYTRVTDVRDNELELQAHLRSRCFYDDTIQIGYLPREISEDCCRFVTGGGEITGIVTGHVRRGKGLEIPCMLVFHHRDRKVKRAVIKAVSSKYQFVEFPDVVERPRGVRERSPVLVTSSPLYETFGSRASAVFAVTNRSTDPSSNCTSTTDCPCSSNSNKTITEEVPITGIKRLNETDERKETDVKKLRYIGHEHGIDAEKQASANEYEQKKPIISASSPPPC